MIIIAPKISNTVNSSPKKITLRIIENTILDKFITLYKLIGIFCIALRLNIQAITIIIDLINTIIKGLKPISKIFLLVNAVNKNAIVENTANTSYIEFFSTAFFGALKKTCNYCIY